MDPKVLAELFSQWQAGQIDWLSVDHSLRSAYSGMAKTEDALVDLDRQPRCGYPEVVYGPGKSSQAIVDVFQAQFKAGQNSLATRVTPEQAEYVLSKVSQVEYDPLSRTLSAIRSKVEASGRVTVVTAGSSDRPIGEEAVTTAKWMGCEVDFILDVGVAGPQRLISQRERLALADCIVVVAGMEGALPSVVAGWVSVPVIAVPTSVGYGANLGGLTTLLGMLTSCAANVAVVNIDAGFKGGYLASLIARRSRYQKKEHD